MTTTLACPDEAELLAVAMGEPVAAAVTTHVDGCPKCQTTLEQLQVELALLRAHRPQAPQSPSITTEPNSGHADANSSGDQPGTTATWETHVQAGETDTFSRTDSLDGDTDPMSGQAPLPAAIGKYLVVGGFPHSGQAEVFRVVHPQFQQERVLKLAKEPVGPDGRSEIVEEGKIMSELEHPHLVRVYDLDFLGDRPYLVMEFIRGRNLEQFAAEEQVAPRRAAALVAKVAGAAAFAHRRGIVHRDIKPKNILVDEAGEPRLIDFGMARLRTAWSDDRKEPDGGTFAFMAPEQARTESPEDRRKVGPRSDVFALGGVLYYLLTGSAPFPGRTWTEAWDRARRCAYDGGALFDRKIPAGLRRICLKAMAADPAGRYATAEEMGRALDRYCQSPFRRTAFALTLILGALVALLGFWKPWNRTSPLNGIEPGAIPSLIEVHRGGRVLDDLSGALPLVTGDRLRIVCDVPHGLEATAFWLDAQGQLEELSPVALLPGDHSDRLVYPRPEQRKDVVALKGSAGTDLLLVCTPRSGKIERREVETVLTTGQALPDMPEQTFMILSNDEVRVRSQRGLGAPEMSSVAEVRDRLEAIRQTLRRRCDFLAGLAVPHRSPTAAHDTEAPEDPH
jgi:eukaryotic-like serine/threonine-protein kinase